MTLAWCLPGNLLARELAASRQQGVPIAAFVFRRDARVDSAILMNVLRPACLASCALAVATGCAVVREERLDESPLRLAARHGR